MINKIEANTIYKEYKNFTLDNISFAIPKGYITGFIGKNGMGKTTTIKSLLSLIKYKGDLEVDGKKVKDYSYLQDVGLVMDDSFLAKDWNIDQVNKVMKLGYDRWDEDLFYSYIDRFAINRQTRVKDLSRGMKIKLMLSIALSHKANMLILDEPTSGLDPSMRDELTDILQEFVEDEDHTVLFSTHITQDLDRIADFIIFIDQGEIIIESTKEDFVNKYLVIKGGLEDYDLLDKDKILGEKKSAVNFEALVERDGYEDIPEKLLVEIPDIDKVMVLYGRRK